MEYTVKEDFTASINGVEISFKKGEKFVGNASQTATLSELGLIETNAKPTIAKEK